MLDSAQAGNIDTIGNSLPDWADKFVSVSEASAITGLAVSTIWQKAGSELPAPYKITANRTAWSFRELQEWISQRKQSARVAA